MQLNSYKTSAERTRLPGRTVQRGAQTGWSALGLALFSIPFLAAGGAIVLVPARAIETDPGQNRAPPWVLAVAGLVFAVGGMLILGMAYRQHASERNRKRQSALHPEEPAFADYAWQVDGFEAPRWRRPLRTFLAASFLTIFLSVFNWWAFVAHGPWLVRGIVACFDALLIACWGTFALQLGRALKFGGSRILFGKFPLRLGEPLVLRWQPATGIKHVNGGSFTLRCVEEWFERRGSGKSASTQLRHECLWSGTWHAAEASLLEAADTLELCFELPAQARPTQLNPEARGERALFWELEARLDLPGLDFQESYLVPLYGGARGGA